MIALGSRFVSPGNINACAEADQRFCRAVHFDAYGYKMPQRMPPLVHFEFSKVEKWESSMVSDQEGQVLNSSTKDMIHGPQSFWYSMKILMRHSEDNMLVCLDDMLSCTDLFEETKSVVKREISSFGPEMAEAAMERGCKRLDIVVKAEEFVRKIYNINELDEHEDEEDDEHEDEEDDEDEYEEYDNEDGDEYEEYDNEDEDNEGVEDSSTMKPAANWSIESLKTTKVADVKVLDEECCVVCLNRFANGAEVAELPCSHIFHKHCAVEWLEKSHLCPICRFEMPL